jgi:hypothetical protein
VKNRALQFLGIVVLLLQGCSGGAVRPEGDVAENQKPPVRREHPASIQESDLIALFTDPKVPTGDVLERCDFEYHVEKSLSKGKQKLFFALPKYVQADPLRYHWCFYYRTQQLVTRVVDANTALVYVEFLADLARIFKADFDDSRYLTHVIQVYRELSRREFFTPLRLSSETIQELGAAGEASPEP